MQNLANHHARDSEIIGVLSGARGLLGCVNHGGTLADYGEFLAHAIRLTAKRLSFRAKHCGGGYSERSEESPAPVSRTHFATAGRFRSAAITARMASYIWLYPVHRQRLLLSASRISGSVGSGFSTNNDFTVIMNPGVQYPHCAPPQSPYAFWIAARVPCSLTPSIVVISCPSQLAASNVQDIIATPSTSTVQAPQDESSHPRFEPVSSRSCRKTSRRIELGSTATS